MLVVSSAFPPLQAPESSHTSELCSRLHAAGVRVQLLTHRRSAGAGGYPFRVRGDLRGWRWHDLSRLMQGIRDARPDVVMLIYLGLMYDKHPMVTLLPTLLRRVLPQTGFVVQFENSWGTEALGLPRPLRKVVGRAARCCGASLEFGTLLRDSDQVIALCQAHAARLRQECPGLGGKLTVIPAPPIAERAMTLNRDQARAALGCRDDDVLIAYFGFVYRAKGVDCLIRAFARIAPQNPRARLAVIGGPIQYSADARDSARYFQQVQDLARSLNVADRVTFTGFVEDVPLTAADVAVLPMHDGLRLNNSSYAAVASQGLPVVATWKHDSDPIFRHEETAMLFRPGDDAELSLHLHRLVNDAALRRELSSASFRISREVISWDAALRATIRVIAKADPRRPV